MPSSYYLLLCSCLQRAKYDIGEEAVHRFSLSAEDKATLELVEWVDSAFRRASVWFRLFNFLILDFMLSQSIIIY